MNLPARQDHFDESFAEAPLIAIVRRPEVNRRPHFLARGFTLWLGGAVCAGLICGLAATSLVDQRRATFQHWTTGPDNTASDNAAPDKGEQTTTVVPVVFPQHLADSVVADDSGSEAQNSQAAADLQRIRIRNRRLEALVKVLRKRDVNERRLSSTHHRN